MLVSEAIKWYNSKWLIILQARNHRDIYKGLYILMKLLRIFNVLYSLSLCYNRNKFVHGIVQKLRAISSTEPRSDCHHFSIPKDKDQEALGLRPMAEVSSNLLGTVLFLSVAWEHLTSVVYLQADGLFLQRDLFYIR